MPTRIEALELLRAASNGAAQDFHPGQWEAIEALVQRRSRVLLVQRTGWGKSMVYFLTTRFLRDAGAGTTLIISPLLALMRNQLEAARRLGLTAETINTTNRDNWNGIMARVRANAVDLLLVSPERLSNDDFLDNCLRPIADRIAFLVVDEAHCISDWGHDFRPDYQRINTILRLLPQNIAVLATTATANNRVVADVRAQLGPNTIVQRGPLARESLQLQNLPLLEPARRLAWLADHLPQMPGSGIVYTLTVRDAERVANWLRTRGIDAHAYHGQIEGDGDGQGDGAQPGREELERRLLNNEIKVLVATSALGMGFDKPDLGFVVHFQVPQSVVHYYQQVGRAGRAIDNAFAVLMGGAEDDDINQYFIAQAFPPAQQVEAVLQALAAADNGLSVPGLMEAVNLRKGQIEKVLKLLSVRDRAPVVKQGSKWLRTANPYVRDDAQIARLAQQRQREWEQMQEYMGSETCLMQFLQRALDDPNPGPCGRCAVCLGRPIIAPTVIQATVTEAVRFCKRSEVVLEPRRRWQAGAFPTYGWNGNIRVEHRVEEGRALALWRDAGWGQLVEDGKAAGQFSDELVNACAAMIRDRWRPAPPPIWVTCVPSLTSPNLVPDFARRLANQLGVPFSAAVRKVRVTERQRNMMNAWHQAHNLDGAFEVDRALVRAGPVLLVDDIADSRWSLTVTGALLRSSGAGAVFPLVLAIATSSSG